MLRVMSLRVRLLLAVLVPVAALITVVGYEAVARAAVAADARSELARTEALERLATAQSLNVLPEPATVAADIRGMGVGVDPLYQLVLDGYWRTFTLDYQAADDARRQMDGPARAVMGQAAWDAFERQRAAVEELVGAVDGGMVDPALVAAAEAARRDADLSLADLAQASSSDAWITYMSSIDAMRAGQVEFAHLFPTLAGLPVATADQLAQLSGERANATERVVLGLRADLRTQVADVLASDDNVRWTEAVARGQDIAAGRAQPMELGELTDLMGRALNLQQRIMDIASQALAQVRAELAATAASAEGSRRQLLAFGGGFTLLALALTGWILRSITGPLRRLTERVAAVASGEIEGDRVTIGGHDELARLGATIEDVADGLRHLERQIMAMTAGDLDDPSLRMAAPGPVGAFVQQRVDDLRLASGRLRVAASSDPLTGLLNRRALTEAVLGRGPRSGDLGVLYLDLDRFKAVNDRHGHHHGDAVLQAVAARLSRLVREGDLVARIGGDEFIVVVAGMNADAVAVLTSRIELAVTEPISVDGVRHRVGCSIGLSWLGPADDLAAALEQADRRMLETKSDRQRRHRR
ncbi:MAG: sensor domain-containing diguanylate cyclase [Acidimicrobiales bacterium]